MVRLEYCSVDLVVGVVTRADGCTLRLTSKEADVLRYLAAKPGEVVDRAQLLSDVWGYADSVLSRASDSTIRRLRRKVEADPSNPTHLLTVHGSGYRFVGLTAPTSPEPAPPRAAEASVVAHLGDRSIDLTRGVLVEPGGEHALTGKQHALLQRLWAAQGAIVGREVLQRAIWGSTRGRALDTAISRLRSRLEPDPNHPQWLVTERGRGYRLLRSETRHVQDDRDFYVERDGADRELAAAFQAPGWTVVVGPAGVGKTRLARRTASDCALPVWWVDALTATDANGLVAATAAALAVHMGPEHGALRVGDVLRRLGRVVVVLDNLEQCVAGAAEVLPDWLRRAPDLTLVGTSRIRLGLDTERIVAVPPLTHAQAARLFERRARAASPRFCSDHEAIGRLVARLDGLPLAIELAASRTGVLTPQQLEARLDQRLDLLTRPHATTPRHRSLRAALSATWDLMDAGEQAALLVLSMFRGGFDADDAEALLPEGAIDTLQGLRDASWVATRFSDALRFEVLESVRAFCAEVRADHADGGRAIELAWCARLARLGDTSALAAPARRPAACPFAQAVEDLEHAARCAARWTAPDLAVRCAVAAAHHRVRHGPFEPALRQLDTVAEDPGEPSSMGWLHLTRAMLLTVLQRREEAEAAQQRSIELAVEATDRILQASALQHEVGLDTDRPRSQAAARRITQASELFSALGHHGRAAYCRGRVQMLLFGDYAEAARQLELAAEIGKQGGDPQLVAIANWHLSMLDGVAGDIPGAVERLLRTADGWRELGDVAGELSALERILRVLPIIGRHELGPPLYDRAMLCVCRTGSDLDEARVSATFGGLCVAAGEVEGGLGQLRVARALLHGQRHEIASYLDRQEAQALLPTDPATALRLAERALAAVPEHIAPSRAAIWALVARCRQIAGHPDEAAAALEHALAETDASYPYAMALVHSARADVRARQGDGIGAREDIVLARTLGTKGGAGHPRSDVMQAADAVEAFLAEQAPPTDPSTRLG